MSDSDKQKAPRTGRWVRWLLAGSLAMNLLVVGLAIGAVMRFGGPENARRPPPSLVATLYRALPREDRQAVRSALHKAPRAQIEDRRAGTRALAAALRGTPFDADRAEAILAEQIRAHDVWEDAVLKAWLSRVSAMDDAERGGYAERVEEFQKRGRRHGRDNTNRKD